MSSFIFFVSHRLLPGLFLVLLCFSKPTFADDATLEKARLEAVLRQLDIIEKLISIDYTQSQNQSARYYLDYARLTTDLYRIRGGIQDYLSPSRAQPRDVTELVGTYRSTSPDFPPAPEDAP